MVPTGGSLRNSSHLAGGLGASKHPHSMEEKGAWEWAPVIPDCGIYGFPGSGQRRGTSLEVLGVVLGQRN